MTVGKGLRKRLVDKSGLLVPDLVGAQYGSLKIVSSAVQNTGFNLLVEVQCNRCGGIHMARFHNIRKRPGTAACPHCNGRQPLTVPQWLYRRCQSQMQRCCNPNSPSFERYGGRGIEFRFSSVNEAATWVAENIGIPENRSLQLDRKDNNGHYEPGNLIWSSAVGNMNNTRVSGNRARFTQFRKMYPHVKYADATLYRMIVQGMTFEAINEQWQEPSCKPKGKYGTFSTLGPYRGSLPTDD